MQRAKLFAPTLFAAVSDLAKEEAQEGTEEDRAGQ
jgi:hypothetical protein